MAMFFALRVFGVLKWRAWSFVFYYSTAYMTTGH